MNTQKTMQAIVQVCGSIDPSLDKMVSDTEKKLGKIDTKALAVGAAAGAIAVGVGKAVIEAGKYLDDLGKDYNKTLNSISASTGATGGELTSIGETVKDVYASNFGDSFEDVGKAISNVKKQTGLLDEDLTVATKSAYLLSDAFEYDIGDTSKAASALIKNLGVDAKEAFNIIAYGAQNGADRSGDMLDTINEYSVQYKSLGLSAEEMMTGFVTAGENGVFMIDKVGDAVKEFNIRSKDGSNSSKEGFELVGMNAEEMFSTFAKGGNDANKAFYEVVNALDKMENPVKKNQAAVALFGTQYEDLEKNILPILSSMQGATLDSIDTLSQINDVKYDDIDFVLEGIKRQVEVNLLPLANVVANSVNDFAPVLGDVIEELTPFLTETANSFEDKLSSTVKLIKELPEFISENKGLIEGVGIAIMALVATIGLYNAAKALGVALNAAEATSIGALITTKWADVAANTAMAASGMAALAPILLIAAGIAAVIAVGVLLYKNWDTIKIKLDELKLKFLEFVKNVRNFFVTGFSNLSNLVKTPINSIIGIVNSAIDRINSIGFEIPNWIPGLGGKAFSINIPKMSYLAEGGFTNGPSIAGEVPGQTEAVISFLPAVRDENIALWQKAGEMLGVNPYQQQTPLQLAGELINLDGFSLGDMGATTIIYYDFSGFEYHPEIHNEVGSNSDENKNIIDELEENKYEFADWFAQWISLATQED